MSFLGIQFVFSLSSGHISRVLQFYQVELDSLPFFWLMAPLAGLILQPLVGHYADYTWTRFGRRRPYIVVGALLTILALVWLPNVGFLYNGTPPYWFLGFLIVLLYGAINLTMDPSRALLADFVAGKEAHLGFSVQTFITGIGAILGSSFPFVYTWFFDAESVTYAHTLSPQVVYSFYVAALVLFFSVTWTVARSKERMYVCPGKRPPLLYAFKTYWVAMPKVMQKLAVVQFFSWFAFFNMWVFATPGVAAHFFGQTDSTTVLYNKAADWVGVMFAVYSAFSALYALGLPYWVRKIGASYTHMLSLCMGALGFISVFFIKDVQYLLLSMLGVGAAWASILSMPFSILLKHIPKEKIGAYMGMFNVFITIPQLVCGLFGGWILRVLLHQQVVAMLYVSGLSLAIAATCTVVFLRKEE